MTDGQYRYLLFDLDDTLFDTKRSQQLALQQVFTEWEHEVTQAHIDDFVAFNLMLWQQMERQELRKDQVVDERFLRYFARYGRTISLAQSRACDERYRQLLASGGHVVAGAEALLHDLQKHYVLYAITNGVSQTQRHRLQLTRLSTLFQGVFISEELGHHKPAPAYFNHVFAAIPQFVRQQALIIGDSLTSDIRGGMTMGVDTCWVSAGQQLPEQYQPTYVIDSVRELPSVLQRK